MNRGAGGIAVPAELRDHPDRLRWNMRYKTSTPSFVPHPLVADALAAGLPDGPVLELACGRSGSALELARTGRSVTATDLSDVGLSQLADEAHQQGLAERIECVLADVPTYDPGDGRFALVLATFYWDVTAFASGCRAVCPGGLIGWDALLRSPVDDDPRRQWHVTHGELSTWLPSRFEVLDERAITAGAHQSTRLLAHASA